MFFHPARLEEKKIVMILVMNNNKLPMLLDFKLIKSDFLH